jgi:transposase
LRNWIASHIRAFEFLGGVTLVVVPDNLKSGVRKPCCRVGGGALARWPPSAAQTVRAVFPHTAFTKAQIARCDPGAVERVPSAPVRLIESVSILRR